MTARLARARARLALGDDDGAEACYLDTLRLDGASFEALSEIGALALRRGRRKAARRAYERALAVNPESPIAYVNLANVLMEDGAHEEARAHYGRALELRPGFAPAHRGLARVFDREGDPRAFTHWPNAGEGGYSKRARRGVGPGVPLALIVSARLGNVSIDPWLDDRLFDAHILEAEYFDPRAPLPPHAVVVNLIADADLCADALRRAHEISRARRAPILNPPERVAATGRIEMARRLSALGGVTTPDIKMTTRARLAVEEAHFPLLLRAPGFHAGRHFLRVERRQDLGAALAELPGEAFMAMNALDARGPDGLHRKYRVMGIGGRLFPLHLAMSDDWKVHYFSASMEARPDCREEERRFLADMPAALGPRACRALAAIGEAIGLDYFGVDFALGRSGELLVFEANAAMAMLDPPPGAMWDYRRPALAAARSAARRMVLEAALGPK